MKRIRACFFTLAWATITVTALTACNKAQWGAGIGAGTGALAGGVIGHQSGHRDEGILIGTAVGALGGYAVGNELDKAGSRQSSPQYYSNQSAPVAAQPQYQTYTPPAHQPPAYGSGGYYSSSGYISGVQTHAPKPAGPPAHAPAHGYRRKHEFRYYPDYQVYFSISQNKYYWLDGVAWTSRSLPPSHVNIISATFVNIELDSPTPQAHHVTIKHKHPPGHSKRAANIPPGQAKKGPKH